MIIEDRGVKDHYLLRTPIYLMTGCIETARFYSNLASASSKMGYYVENIIVKLVKLPIIKYENLFGYDKKAIVVKPKIYGMVPDFLLFDPLKKLIIVYEVKTNLKNLDSRQAIAEKDKHQKLYEHFSELFINFEIQMNVVDFIEGESLKVNLYKNDLLLKTVTGKSFCENIEISYDEVLEYIEKNRNSNLEFIKKYKEKEIRYIDDIQSKSENLEKFYEFT